MMRGIRKSLKGEKDRRASSNSSGSHSRMSSFNGSSSANFTASLVAASSTSLSAHSSTKDTPKKIIKATSDYTAQNPQEISFQIGDFFWVVGRENDTDFFEVTNPLTNVKGLVPVDSFEVMNQRKRPDSVNKNNSFIISNLHLSNSPSSISTDRFSNTSSRRPSVAGLTSFSSNSNLSATPNTSLNNNNINNNNSSVSTSPNPNSDSQVVLYGTVMYDFEARPDSDELDVSKGETLVLCAHHDFEWFIAKPIKRLGGPGLVPVAYIKILNLSSNKKTVSGDIVEEIKESGLPTVGEWKNKTARYKATSINLIDEEIYHNQNSLAHQNSFVQQQKTLYEYDDQVTMNSSVNNEKSQHHQSSGQNSYSIFTSSPYDNDISSLYDEKIYVIDVKIDNFYYNKIDEKHGRYWYHVVARLSNHKVRSLSRYYDDFYELHSHLQKKFDNESIPLIPAPQPNIEAQIAYSRFEQLNEYLRKLISSPDSISKSKLSLIFFSLKDDIDKEFNEDDESIELPTINGINEDGQEHIKNEITSETQQPPSLQSTSIRSSKESQLSSQLGNLNLKTNSLSTNATSASNDQPLIDENSQEGDHRPTLKISTSNFSPNATLLSGGGNGMTTNPSFISPPMSINSTIGPIKNIKVKFYYEDDIFAISVPTNISLIDIKTKIANRIDHKVEQIKLFIKGKNVTEFTEDDDLSKEIDNDEFLRNLIKRDPKLKLIVITDESI